MIKKQKGRKLNILLVRVSVCLFYFTYCRIACKSSVFCGAIDDFFFLGIMLYRHLGR